MGKEVWAKLRTSGANRDYIYGFCDGTNNHGHFVASGGEIIYDRRLNGTNLLPTIFGLPVEMTKISGHLVVAFAEAVIESRKEPKVSSGRFRVPLEKN